MEALTSFMEALPSWSNYLPKASKLLYWRFSFNIWILERDTNIQLKPNAYTYFWNKDDDKRKEEERELEDENNKERKKTLRESGEQKESNRKAFYI